MSSILKRFRKKRYRQVADPATLWYDEGDMDNFLFPEASEILHEAIQRHQGVFPYVVEAIDLAHLAYGRERDQSSRYVPGIPHIRRVRNDINDDAWRFLRMIGEPLVSAGLIRAFVSVTNHDLVILPDGLIARLKKGAPPDGMTSNYPTPNVQRMATASERVTLFCEATPLDEAIQSGVTFDIVYVAALAMGEYTHAGLRFAATQASPILVLDPPTPAVLRSISPAAYDLVTDARQKLAS